MNENVKTILDIFLGGLFGTLVTVGVTAWIERKRKTEEQKSKFLWLLAEITDNLEHADHYRLAGGRAHAKLLTQAWESVKGDTVELDREIANSLRATYAEVWRFSCIVEYDLIRVPMGNGALNGVIEIQAGLAKTALSDSREKLSGYLKV